MTITHHGQSYCRPEAVNDLKGTETAFAFTETKELEKRENEKGGILLAPLQKLIESESDPLSKTNAEVN